MEVGRLSLLLSSLRRLRREGGSEREKEGEEGRDGERRGETGRDRKKERRGIERERGKSVFSSLPLLFLRGRIWGEGWFRGRFSVPEW